jgi:predicted TIM-barrel fold metal-dependent hydrolase
MLIDAHVHLLGIGDGGSGCVMSPTMKSSLLYRFMKRRLGLVDGHVDAGYLDLLVRAKRSSRFDRLMLFAQDGVYDRHGIREEFGTHLYVPNDYVLDVARAHPGDFWACASINPARRDAMEELDRVVELGARMVKVHPPIQGIDPGEPRFRPFWRRIAALGVVLVIHTGHEHSAPIHGQSLAHPSRIEPALEEGATVVAAHAGTCAVYDAQDFYPAFRALLEKWPNLYADTAILGNVFRLGSLRRLAADPLVRSRLIHGSDFPLPASTVVWRAPGLIFERNLLERDARVKAAYGVFEEQARRGAKLVEGRERGAAQRSTPTALPIGSA